MIELITDFGDKLMGKGNIEISEADIKKIKESGGERLSPSLKHKLETEFKADLSDVRIHTGTHAFRVTTKLNAKAYSYDNHIMFNVGEFQPNTEEGKKLLSHELTHVIQQKSNKIY